ncbi:MAG: iron-sulfur cluster loop [Patescibacteria group bacterium]
MDNEFKKAEISELLIKRGQALLDRPKEIVNFTTNNNQAEKLLNNLDKYPHAFVLACVMDRQIPAERAWVIPYKISQELNTFEITELLKLSKEQYIELFNNKKLHRFNTDMAENFFYALQDIKNKYKSNAANIWLGKPSSALLVKRFQEFRGVGIKISTMAANILVRDFKIEVKDKICIDVSPDVHLRRVFKRIGFTKKENSEELVYAARELHPDYPGIFDLSCWEIGHNWCRPKNPDCQKCYLNSLCPKIISEK